MEPRDAIRRRHRHDGARRQARGRLRRRRFAPPHVVQRRAPHRRDARVVPRSFLHPEPRVAEKEVFVVRVARVFARVARTPREVQVIRLLSLAPLRSPLVEPVDERDAPPATQQPPERGLLAQGLASRVEHAEVVRLLARPGERRHQAPRHGLHAALSGRLASRRVRRAHARKRRTGSRVVPRDVRLAVDPLRGAGSRRDALGGERRARAAAHLPRRRPRARSSGDDVVKTEAESRRRVYRRRARRDATRRDATRVSATRAFYKLRNTPVCYGIAR